MAGFGTMKSLVLGISFLLIQTSIAHPISEELVRGRNIDNVTLPELPFDLNTRDQKDLGASCQMKNIPPWLLVGISGGNKNGGSEACASKWVDGIFPTEVEAISDKESIRTLKITYSDGTFTLLGTTGDVKVYQKGSVKWDPLKDYVEEMRLYGGGWNSGIGRIYMKISNGQVLEVDNKDDNNGNPIMIKTGLKGIFLGFFARHGGNEGGIDYLEPYFTPSKFSELQLVDVLLSPTFEDLNKRPQKERGLVPDVSAKMYFANDRKSDDVKVTMEVWLASTEGTTWNHDEKVEYMAKASIKVSAKFQAGIPLVGQGEVGVEVGGEWGSTWGHSDSSGGMKSQEVRVKSGLETVVKPGGVLVCQAIGIQGQVDLKYSSNVNIVLDDGHRIVFTTQGSTSQAKSSTFRTSCKDTDRATMEKDIASGVGAEASDPNGSYDQNGNYRGPVAS